MGGEVNKWAGDVNKWGVEINNRWAQSSTMVTKMAMKTDVIIF